MDRAQVLAAGQERSLDVSDKGEQILHVLGCRDPKVFMLKPDANSYLKRNYFLERRDRMKRQTL